MTGLPRPGAHMAAMCARRLVDAEASTRRIDAVLRATGFELQASTRPYRRKDGLVTARLVWRRRGDGASCVVHRRIRPEKMP